MRKQCKAAGIVDTSANLWKFYVNKCRNNLHLVLAMSPSGDKLRLRCRSFPGLISNCVIDWFFPWPESVQKSMFRGAAAPSLPWMDSCPSDEVVGGFFVEFEAVQTASGPSRRVRETAVASMASSRDSAAATPSS